MTDYYMQVHGEYSGSLSWSFGQRMSSSASESTVATSWHDAWNTAWTSGSFGLQTLYPTSTAITHVTVSTLDFRMRELTKTPLDLALAGISSADGLPRQEAVVVSWRGNNIQRYGRGRWYLPALTEDQVNNDLVISTAATRIKNAVQSVYSAMTTSGSTFFVTNMKDIHDKRTGVVIVAAFTKQIVTTPLIARKPARQARRVRKVPSIYI